MFTFGTKKIPLFLYCGPEITGKISSINSFSFNQLLFHRNISSIKEEIFCGIFSENGKFDFFHHIRFNKLSIDMKNSEEKKAYEVEEENLESFFLKK